MHYNINLNVYMNLLYQFLKNLFYLDFESFKWGKVTTKQLQAWCVWRVGNNSATILCSQLLYLAKHPSLKDLTIYELGNTCIWKPAWVLSGNPRVMSAFVFSGTDKNEMLHQARTLAPGSPFRFLWEVKSSFLMRSLELQGDITSPAALNRCSESGDSTPSGTSCCVSAEQEDQLRGE